MFKRVLLALLLVALPFHVQTAGKTVINIKGEITDEMAEKVIVDASTATGTIEIHINSPGGSVEAGLVIIRAIRSTNLPTVCIVEDYAASMAANIFESAACGTRIMEASSILMFHPIYFGGSVRGTPAEMERAAKALAAFNRSMAVTISSRIGMTPEEYEKMIAEDFWVVGYEAVALNMVDDIIPVQAPVARPSDM